MSNKPDYVEAKNRLERIDSLIHAEAMGVKEETSMKEAGEEKIEEGQIKKLSFYKSKVKFDSVIGLDKTKKFLQDNIILAIKEPALFKKYGKKLGVGLLLYGRRGVGKTHIVNAIAGEARQT